MARTVFLVDGFNLYYGMVDAAAKSQKTTKWLDLRGLCESYLPLIGGLTHSRAILERIHYFSATPRHRPQGTRERHALYMRCLKSSGVVVELARFKAKELKCPLCHRTFKKHEEKETDVALAVHLFETCVANAADAIVLVTGDTDLAPAVRTCRRLFPEKTILFAFPYKRVNAELKALAPESFKIGLKAVLRFQLQDPHPLADGTTLAKPRNW